MDRNRLSLAERLGATVIVDPGKANLEEAVMEAARGKGTEVVIETAGTVKTTQQTISLAGTGGVVVQVGWPEDNIVPYDIASVMEKELDIRGLNRYANAYAQAISLASSGRIELKPLITHRFNLESISEAFDFVSKKSEGVIKAVVLS